MSKGFFRKFKKWLSPNGYNPIVNQLGTKIVSLTVAFLIITPFIPLYQFTEGNFYDEGIDIIDFTDQDTDFSLADVMTEDGFLLKPALNTTAGDRSGLNEIFAYSVEPGDTISSIAQRFGIKKETIMMENDMWDANRVRTGMTLKILPVDGISHLVKKGHTVKSIAKKYKVEEADIIRQNQLEDTELLVGTALIIPGAKKAVSKPYYAASAPSSPSAGYAGQVKGQLLWPVGSGGRLTQGFRRGHYAIDIGNRSKGPIRAAKSGKVIFSKNGWNGGYGNHIIIDHGGGMQTLYAHNEKLYVSEGQYVEQGQTIAWMGRTGRVYGKTGIHLHFEVRINGVKYNPMHFF